MRLFPTLCCCLIAANFAPLSAQQTVEIPVPDVNVNLPPMQVTNEITVEVMSDSVADARIAEAMESIAGEIAAQGCDQCAGTSGVVRVGQGALVLMLGYVAYQLKRIADRPHHRHDHVVNVTLPPDGDDDDHDSEGGSPR